MKQSKPRVTSSSLELIDDPSIILDKLQNLKSRMFGFESDYLPVMAFSRVLDAAILNLGQENNKTLYVFFPWETDVDLPSFPSLVADAGQYCSITNQNQNSRLIVDSFAQWVSLLKREEFCSCERRRLRGFFSKSRMVPIEIVINHHIGVDRESGTLDIKQFVGIKSDDRDHVEFHYSLGKESRVDKDISIVKTNVVRLKLGTFEVTSHIDECTKEFDAEIFKRIFMELCRNALSVQPA